MLDFLVGNDLLSALIAFVLVLIPAVIVHELGHFLAARAIGVSVLEFGIGFPPRVARLFTWRETEFTLNLIPLGGFVRPLGEDLVGPTAGADSESSDEEPDSSAEMSQRNRQKQQDYLSERDELAQRGYTDVKAVHEAKPLPRIFFMAAGAVANFLFAFLVFVVIGLIGLPEVVGARVGIAEVEPGTPVAELGLQSGDFIERVDGDYFDDDDALFERLRQSIGQPVTLQVRRVASEPHEILMLDVVPTAALLDMLESTGTYVFVIEVDAESPAGEAGLLPGDLIAAINGISLTEAADPTTELQMLTERFAGQDVPLEILRDGEILTVRLTPRLDPPPGGGRIGVTIRSEQVNPESGFIYVETEQRDFIPQPPLVALEYGIDRTMTILGMIVEFPARLLGGDTDPVERRVVSVVGVSQLGGAILQDSIQEEQSGILFEYIALISIALGFTNLLPIPALDGGRILFVVLEMIRGKPIPPEREGYVHMIGLIFLLTAAVFFIINDLVNPLTDILR